MDKTNKKKLTEEELEQIRQARKERARVLDAQRKREKYNSDPEYRKKRNDENIQRYYRNKPEFRKCKSCDVEVEYKPRIVYCLDCYLKYLNKEPSFIPEN